MSWGDFPLGETLNHFFTTRAFATGIPTVLSGTPVLSVYEDTNLTQITAGVTVTVDADSIVGLNRANIVATSGNGYETNKSYTIVITTGTVGGVSVVGEVVGTFTVERGAAFIRLGAPAGASVSADIATVDTVVDGIQTDLDNGTDGLGAIKTETALIVADTNELQTDDVPGLIATLDAVVDTVKAETVLIVADTNELQTDWADAGRLDVILDARMAEASIDTTAGAVDNVTLVATTTTNTDVRGTDSAALAVDVGTLADAAAAGEPTSADTLMQYIKQLINILIGTTGITTFPSEAAPANNVSLAEVIRAIHSDVTGLAGSTMRGTDSAALASVATEARLSELDAATGGKMANQIDIIQTDTTTDIPATITTVDTVVDGIQTDLDNATDGLGALKTLIDAIQVVVDKVPLSDGAVTWNSTALASINAEVDTALDTAISEIAQGVPSSTPTVRTGIMLMYMALRNKLDVATSGTDTLEIHNDAGTRITQKLITDDDTDYSEAKMTSGA